jgi:PEGA domain-containing protein
MTTQVKPRGPLVVLVDDWEPPPRHRRFPLFRAACGIGLAIVGIAFLSTPRGDWIRSAAHSALGAPDPQDSEIPQPRPARNGGGGGRDLWYPRDSVAPPPPRLPTESARLPVIATPRGPVSQASQVPVNRAQTFPVHRSQAPIEPAVAPSRTSLPGYLMINSTPWAMLSVDGQVVGNTPQLRITVYPGQHELVLTRDGFETYRTLVTVAAGATLRVTDISLERSTP